MTGNNPSTQPPANSDNKESEEVFHCVMCHYSVALRDNEREIICTQTFEMYEKNHIASCEYAKSKK